MAHIHEWAQTRSFSEARAYSAAILPFRARTARRPSHRKSPVAERMRAATDMTHVDLAKTLGTPERLRDLLMG